MPDSRLRLPRRATVLHDVVAGFTVGASQVGNAMAYTMLAGVPPVHGLYATMVGTPAGGLLAGTQRMTIVPTAALCLAAGEALASLPQDQRVPGLLVLALLTGGFMLLAGLLRAGSLLRFISNAVIVGFMLGVAVQIVLGQLTSLTGFSSDQAHRVAKVADMVTHAASVDVPTTLVGISTIALILALTRTRLRLFAMATALLALTVAVSALGLGSVAVVGDIAPIPRSLPQPHLPDLSLAPNLVLPAFSLALIGLVQGAGISRWMRNRDGSRGGADRDFVAQGAANLAAGLFGGAVLGGSVQATALNTKAGSQTRWSAVLAGVVVTVVVVAVAPLVQQVPQAVTAGILIVAATSAIRPRAAREIWRADRLSAAIMITTFILVVAIPLHYAILIGSALSVLKYVYLSSLDVRIVRIVLTPEGRAREEAAPPRLDDHAVTVLDVYGSLFFAAGPKLKESLPSAAASRHAVAVLRVRGRGTLHSATIGLIREYAEQLVAGGGRLYIAGVGAEMLDQFRRTGLLEMLGEDAILPAGDELYSSCEAAVRRGDAWLAAHDRGAEAEIEADPQPAKEHEGRD